jgi:hypothetical protein
MRRKQLFCCVAELYIKYRYVERERERGGGGGGMAGVYHYIISELSSAKRITMDSNKTTEEQWSTKLVQITQYAVCNDHFTDHHTQETSNWIDWLWVSTPHRVSPAHHAACIWHLAPQVWILASSNGRRSTQMGSQDSAVVQVGVRIYDINWRQPPGVRNTSVTAERVCPPRIWSHAWKHMPTINYLPNHAVYQTRRSSTGKSTTVA